MKGHNVPIPNKSGDIEGPQPIKGLTQYSLSLSLSLSLSDFSPPTPNKRLNLTQFVAHKGSISCPNRISHCGEFETNTSTNNSPVVGIHHPLFLLLETFSFPTGAIRASLMDTHCTIHTVSLFLVIATQSTRGKNSSKPVVVIGELKFN